MEPLRGTGPIQLPTNILPEPPSKGFRPVQAASPTSGDIRALPADEPSAIETHATPHHGDRVLKQGGGGNGHLDHMVVGPKTGPLSLSQIDLGAIVKSAAGQKVPAPASEPIDTIDLSDAQFGRPTIQSGGGGNGSL